MRSMRVVVTGGRSYANRDVVAEELWALYENDPSEFIVAHGGAKGADMLADDWCDLVGVEKLVYPANWAVHGRAAGPIRNRKMLEEFRPAIVLAFPGGRGTANCVRTARELGILVKEVK